MARRGIIAGFIVSGLFVIGIAAFFLGVVSARPMGLRDTGRLRGKLLDEAKCRGGSTRFQQNQEEER